MKENPYKRKPKKYHKARRKYPKYQWTDAKYRTVVAGNNKLGIPGLRSIVNGFESRDGFSLAGIPDWSATQKRKVRTWFARLEAIQAQPKRIVRARGTNLRKLQEAFHGGIPSDEMKVAFVPDTDPVLTLPGAKKHPPKVRVLKEGVSIERPQYERLFIPFDQKSLAKNARQEVARAAKGMPGAQLYFVQVGEYQSVTGKSLGLLTQQVLDWMNKYDGKRPLPENSGNKGDDPRHHHWKKWLNGLIGYRLPKRVDIRNIGRIIFEGRRKNEELRAERQRYMKRKGERGRE